MRLSLIFMLMCANISAQDTVNDRSRHSSIQLETGLFGNFFYTGLSPGQMENLTGIKQPAWGAPTQPEYGEGTRSGVSAGYYTFTYQQLFPSAKTIWWAAGLSFLHRTLAETFFYTDTVYSAASGASTSGDSLYTKKSWHGSAGLWGLQLNLPIGIRFMHADLDKRWLSIGINLSPGFTFNHRYHESFSVASYTRAAAQREQHMTFHAASSSALQHYSITRLPGMYFNLYASLPIQCNFNPARKWQFLLTLEPGYSITFLDKRSPSTSFMLRMGLGVKRLL